MFGIAQNTIQIIKKANTTINRLSNETQTKNPAINATKSTTCSTNEYNKNNIFFKPDVTLVFAPALAHLYTSKAPLCSLLDQPSEAPKL